MGVFEHTEGQIEYEGPSRENLIRLVMAGRGLDALVSCLAFPVVIKALDRVPLWRLWHGKLFLDLLLGLRRVKLRRWCVRARQTLSAEDWFNEFYLRHSPVSGDLFSYSFYRFSQPRHLAALALISLLPAREKPLLDLACGFGHL